MNLILEQTDQVAYFTEMRSVFRALNISASDYDWYVSNLETNKAIAGLANADQWMTGEGLQRLIDEHEIQFIWAVFSAVPKGARPEINGAPFADGNSRYWDDIQYAPQLESALFEITCWDSSATILAGITPEMAINFKNAYSDAKPLPAADGNDG